MTHRSPRQRRTGHDKIMSPLAHFSEDLIQNQAVTHADFDGDSELFEALLLRQQIASKLRSRSQESLDIFLEVDKMGVNRGRLGHDVKQRDGGTERGSQFAR